MKLYKIAVVAACPFPYSRGTPVRIFRMAEALAAHGHDVHVITYHLGQKLDELPFKLHRIPYVPTYQKTSPGPSYQKLTVLDPLLCLKIISVIRRHNLDIIHAHHYEGLITALPAARLLHIPLVFDSHTLLAPELPHYPLGIPANILGKIGAQLDHWLPPKAAHIVTVNNLIRNQLIKEIGIPETKTTTVYGGIELNHFSAAAVKEPASTQNTLIYTGNLASYQGIDLMFRAFSKVLEHHNDVCLKIVTDDPLSPYDDLIESLHIRDKLLLEKGNYFDLPSQLRSGAIALHPRVGSNGMPIKLLNYMATGRAIVSFEGFAEVLQNEITGLVVPKNDIEAFSHAILRLLDSPDLVKKLGAAAQLTTQQFFVWEKSVNLLESIYLSLLDKTN